MIIPPKTLEKLASMGFLEVPEGIAEGYSVGYKVGEEDTVEFFDRLLIREQSVVSVFPLDNDIPDEYIRGYTQCLKNLTEKFKIKYA